MITNDKGCGIRRETLPLSWWRRPLRLRRGPWSRGLRRRRVLALRRRHPGQHAGRCTARSAPSVPGRDGGI